MRKIVFGLFFLTSIASQAQEITMVNPPNWWVGMQYNQVEVVLKGNNISKATFKLTNALGAKIAKKQTDENPNYVYLTLDLKAAKAGTIQIEYTLDGKQYKYPYEIKAREKHTDGLKGLQPSDLMYLITPDRFANGDESNDKFPDMRETIIKRDSNVARHGGDLKGVIQHLDYIKDLGMTATWLNPIEENNQSFQSYHGYGMTDFFAIDKRYGTLDDYTEYVKQSHQKGLKVVKDVVYNHPGHNHWSAAEPPSSTWYNTKEVTNYRISAKFDPHASEDDKRKADKGWFDIPALPDFNQKNPHVANFLTQYSLWWIEKFGVDAYRVDTFAYPDQDFMWKMMETIKKEYPNFTIFGEIWDSGEPTQAYYTQNRTPQYKVSKYIQDVGITDFEMQYAMVDACKEDTGWNTGLAKMYYTLTFDWLYKDPMKNVLFLGNHDIDRYFGTINKDLQCYKMTTSLLLTQRGIPQLYYGDEILFAQSGHHGTIRADFPGGWKDDKDNKFTAQGRTAEENDYFEYLKKLATWRTANPDVLNGKLVQFVPDNETYIYFRIAQSGKTVMVAVNANKTEEKPVPVARFKEILSKFKTGKNVVTNQSIDITQDFKIPARTAWVLELE